MGGPVVGREPAAIHAEDHRQILQADIVHDGVEGALQEGGVDGAEGLVTLGGETRREQHGVLFGDAHIEVLIGMVRLEAVETGAVGHGGGDGHHFGIVVGQLHQRVGEDFGVSAAAQRLGLAGLRIVRAQAVKLLLLLHGGLEALALLGEHMQQHGAVLLLEEFESLDQRGGIVAVDGAVVFQAEFLEDDAGPQHALGDFFGFARHAQRGLAADLLHQFAGGDRAGSRSAGW